MAPVRAIKAEFETAGGVLRAWLCPRAGKVRALPAMPNRGGSMRI